MGTDSQMESRITAVGQGEGEEIEGLNNKERGLMDTDNSAVIAGKRGV